VLFGAAAKLCHVGLRPGLVEEDQTSGIDQGLTGAPARAVAAYVWPIPLRAMRVFLNVTPGSSIGVPDLLDPQRSKNAEAANSHFPVRIPMPSGQVISGRLKAEAVLMNCRCISPSDGDGGAILPVAHGCGDISKVVSLLARHLVAGALRAQGMVFCGPASRGRPGAAWVSWRAWAPPSISSHKTADAAFHAPLRSSRFGREQTTARILSHGQPSADCDFNLAALHPAYPIKRLTSAQITQASQGVEIRKKLAPLTH
jgi:hypothetical protein